MRILILFSILALLLSGCNSSNKKTKTDKLSDVKEMTDDQAPVSVNEENYALAMADMAMQREFEQGANNTNWHHHYNIMELDKQPAPMMNRDTKYSFSILDGGGDVAITLPETDGRYMSLHIWNHDHVTYKVFYGPGRYVIPASVTSDYFVANVRTQVDSKDPEDVKKSSEFQNQLKIEYLDGYQPKPFKATKWNMDEFNKIHQKYVEIANQQGIMGTMGTIDNPVSLEDRNRGVAVGTGLLPDKDAVYLTGKYDVNKGNKYQVTYAVPEMVNPELGFYSITVYGDDQYLKTDMGSTLSNRDIKLNPDGKSFTITYVFQEDFDNSDNQLVIPTETFWINFRVYMPGQSIIDGEYILPKVK
jgi:hypothetical protein